jgi:histidine triad (HIT) family protein
MENNCLFCKIVSGAIASEGIFWQDDNFMAFLSIFPSVEGFTVIVPKKHYPSDVLMMPDEELKSFIIVAKQVSQILLKHFPDVGRVGLVMEGLGIDHAHIKLIPMHGTPNLKKGIWEKIESGKLDYFETYPGYLASNDGPPADPNKIKELAEKLKEVKL